MSKTRVLFLCVHNSARSQIAEAFLRELGSDRYEAYSAGFEPTAVDPLVVAVMAERGIDISGWHAKSLKEYMGQVHFGYLITVCQRAQEACPSAFPGVSVRLHWPFPDPAEAEGPEEARLVRYRQIRDQIEERITAWLAEQDAPGAPGVTP